MQLMNFITAYPVSRKRSFPIFSITFISSIQTFFSLNLALIILS